MSFRDRASRGTGSSGSSTSLAGWTDGCRGNPARRIERGGPLRYIISATLALGAIACSTPAADPPAAVRDAAQAVGNVLDSWKKKLDDPSAKPDSVSLSAERDAISITSGPAGIYYKSDMKAEKDYTASATFSELKATPQPVEYGLFVAGTNL